MGTKTKHTPGPWKATKRPVEAVTNIESAAINGARGWVANVFGTEGENEANARLIAAAPSFAKAWSMVPEEIRERILCAVDDADARAIEGATR